MAESNGKTSIVRLKIWSEMDVSIIFFVVTLCIIYNAIHLKA
jgi:hypothetical protein